MDDDAVDAYRHFARELTLRFERTIKSLVKEMREERRMTHRYLESILIEGREHYEDLRAESRAQTEALLRMLDRLDGGDAAPAS